LEIYVITTIADIAVTLMILQNRADDIDYINSRIAALPAIGRAIVISFRAAALSPPRFSLPPPAAASDARRRFSALMMPRAALSRLSFAELRH
jgi:hypothetical protein